MFNQYFDKTNKYIKKLELSKDPIKNEIYQNKINYYSKQQQRNNVMETNIIKLPNVELLKPTDYQGNYVLNVNTNPIRAIGYGTDHKDKKLRLMEFDRRAPRDNDVVINIAFCGVCHSDWHVILDEWRNSKYPIVVGHEITGTIIKIGNAVTKFKVGDKVAVGPNYDSCRSCNMCEKGIEQYCENGVTEIYNMPDRMYVGQLKANGQVTQGGYCNILTIDEKFVLALPNEAPLDRAAPLLCAGITMYTPLKTFIKEFKTTGKQQNIRVGIAGIGGLGSMGIKLAKAFGFEVIGLSCTADKVKNNDLGANEMLLMKDFNIDKRLAYYKTFDLIIDTIPYSHNLMPYVALLRPLGTLWIVGSFQDQVIPQNEVNRLGITVRGSSTGNISDTQEFINLCVKKGIYPDIQKINIQDINETHKKLINSDVRYRFVIDMSSLNI